MTGEKLIATHTREPARCTRRFCYLLEGSADVTVKHDLLETVAGFAGVEFGERIDGVTLRFASAWNLRGWAVRALAKGGRARGSARRSGARAPGVRVLEASEMSGAISTPDISDAYTRVQFRPVGHFRTFRTGAHGVITLASIVYPPTAAVSTRRFTNPLMTSRRRRRSMP